MNELTLTPKEQTFLSAYIEAVYFTDTGDCEQPETDAELDDNFLRASMIDCLAMFQRIECYMTVCDVAGLGNVIEQAGHDFWLTRNGHGVGYWDRPEVYGQTYADMFTKIAESFGGADSYFEGEAS